MIEPLRAKAAEQWDEINLAAGGGRPPISQPKLVEHVTLSRIIQLPHTVTAVSREIIEAVIDASPPVPVN